jgi:hypothetical protein
VKDTGYKQKDCGKSKCHGSHAEISLSMLARTSVTGLPRDGKVKAAIRSKIDPHSRAFLPPNDKGNESKLRWFVCFLGGGFGCLLLWRGREVWEGYGAYVGRKIAELFVSGRQDDGLVGGSASDRNEGGLAQQHGVGIRVSDLEVELGRGRSLGFAGLRLA